MLRLVLVLVLLFPAFNSLALDPYNFTPTPESLRSLNNSPLTSAKIADFKTGKIHTTANIAGRTVPATLRFASGAGLIHFLTKSRTAFFLTGVGLAGYAINEANELINPITPETLIYSGKFTDAQVRYGFTLQMAHDLAKADVPQDWEFDPNTSTNPNQISQRVGAPNTYKNKTVFSKYWGQCSGSTSGQVPLCDLDAVPLDVTAQSLINNLFDALGTALNSNPDATLNDVTNPLPNANPQDMPDAVIQIAPDAIADIPPAELPDFIKDAIPELNPDPEPDPESDLENDSQTASNVQDVNVLNQIDQPLTQDQFEESIQAQRDADIQDILDFDWDAEMPFTENLYDVLLLTINELDFDFFIFDLVAHLHIRNSCVGFTISDLSMNTLDNVPNIVVDRHCQPYDNYIRPFLVASLYLFTAISLYRIFLRALL